MGQTGSKSKPNPLPTIPAPPEINAFLSRGGMESWLYSFPNEGQLRTLCQNAFQRGYLLPINPEAQAARTHSGEIQRFLDSIYKNAIGYRETFINMSSFVFSLDKKGNLVVNTGGYEQLLEMCGDEIKVWETMNVWKSQIVQDTSGKDDAEKWFSNAVQEQRSIGHLTYGWLHSIIDTSLEAISRYKAVSPPTTESVYYAEYYERVYQLATSTKPEIEEQIEDDKETERARQEVSQLFTDYKWWILGGSAGVCGLYLLWQAL